MSTAPTSLSRPVLAYGPPSEMLVDGTRRLRMACLAIVLLVAVALVFQVAAGAAGWGAPGHAVAAALVAVSLLMWWLARTPRVAPALVLDIGLLYHVAVSLAISILENLVAWPETGFVRGVSWVCVWIVLFPLVVPGSPLKTLLAAVSSAAMGVIAHLIAIAFGRPVPETLTFITLYAPNLAAVFLATLSARVIYRMASRVSEARQMGSWVLVERLGRGGMGEVWRAEHRRLPRQAAVKFIRPDVLRDGLGSHATVAMRRFEREARATAQLRSPYTVELYDFGVSDDGTLYYVMELLEGTDLQRLVTRLGPLPPERVVHVLVQVCRSLGEAHDLGLVHRDIKPANLVLCRLGGEVDCVKVLDFGLARPTRKAVSAAELTDADALGGTPAYMAPEVILGDAEIDARADIYALGCVAWFLLTGAAVFPDRTPVNTLMAHVRDHPPPLRETASQPIPPALAELVMQCLEKDPAARPASVDRLAASLGRIELARPWTHERAAEWWRTHGGESDTAPPTPDVASAASDDPMAEQDTRRC